MERMINMRSYSDKIKELRATLNWSQTKLAEYLNVSLASVNRWEKIIMIQLLLPKKN